MTSSSSDKNDSPYELIYWPVLPGRGEYVRLVLEEAGVPYNDTGFQDRATLGRVFAAAKAGVDVSSGIGDENIQKSLGAVMAQIADHNYGDATNVPPFAPPILKHGDVVISQTSNILMYLGPKLGLAASAGTSGHEADPYRINALALTALDGFCNEVHNCHHPISNDLQYEQQKEESIRRSKEWVKTRLPKLLFYFERVLKGEASGDGPWLYGGVLTYADLVLFQALDGTMFMFPKAIAAAKATGKYDLVFQHHEAVKSRPRIAEYLASERRRPYSIGIYRYYEELDVVAEETTTD